MSKSDILQAQKRYIRSLPERLTPVPPEEWAKVDPMPTQVWRSRRYLAQLYEEASADYPGLRRLSVCRAEMGRDGRWEDGLTWDELQTIKREVGLGDLYGIEVYPAEAEVINHANMRHLWLLPTPLAIGWFSTAKE